MLFGKNKWFYCHYTGCLDSLTNTLLAQCPHPFSSQYFNYSRWRQVSLLLTYLWFVNDNVSSSDYTVLNSRTLVDWKGYERKQSWSKWRYWKAARKDWRKSREVSGLSVPHLRSEWTLHKYNSETLLFEQTLIRGYTYSTLSVLISL